jgi:hypothetical protein
VKAAHAQQEVRNQAQYLGAKPRFARYALDRRPQPPLAFWGQQDSAEASALTTAMLAAVPLIQSGRPLAASIAQHETRTSTPASSARSVSAVAST